MNQTKPSRSTWQLLLLIVTSNVCATVLLIIFGIWKTSDRFLATLQGFLQPQPLQLQSEISGAIAEKIKSVEELTTTVYTIETVVPTSADRKIGKFSLATTKLLYIARGEVKAGIDLSNITANNISVSDNQITVNLPSPQILDSKIDVNASRVYDYDRGFLNLGPDVAPQLQTLAQRQTLEYIVNNACHDGILTTANKKAETAIAQLLTITNDRDIAVKTTATSPQLCLESVKAE
ncbi:DUF4230 domain-containing protein [Myxosarcina sp. GI1]|uniref:DUF4230 domain-containing protein n=1 Tax=Myxosarcina sp. GI1 TaxID=1541065 RepID=UPI0005661C2B|nr:DUF4230 domain-containing protein [Myxosarcina sp. GI1]